MVMSPITEEFFLHPPSTHPPTHNHHGPRQQIRRRLSQSACASDQVRRIAREIMASVNDPDMAASTPTKVARAVAGERQMSQVELAEVLDRIIAGRKSGEILNPGGYFTACARCLFRKHGIPMAQRCRATQAPEQRTMFDAFDAAFVADTRALAAAAIAPMKPNMLRQVLVFVASRGHNGATDEEIADGLEMRESTARIRGVSNSATAAR